MTASTAQHIYEELEAALIDHDTVRAHRLADELLADDPVTYVQKEES